jgi:hypothetical protein
MEIRESSQYVKARAVLLAEYFVGRGWLVVEGKNNCILFKSRRDNHSIILSSNWPILSLNLIFI